MGEGYGEGEMVLNGTLKAFDAATYKATVQLDGSLGTYLTNVPVARAIPSAEMVAGRTVALLFFAPDSPDAALLSPPSSRENTYLGRGEPRPPPFACHRHPALCPTYASADTLRRRSTAWTSAC